MYDVVVPQWKRRQMALLVLAIFHFTGGQLLPRVWSLDAGVWAPIIHKPSYIHISIHTSGFGRVTLGTGDRSILGPKNWSQVFDRNHGSDDRN